MSFFVKFVCFFMIKMYKLIPDILEDMRECEGGEDSQLPLQPVEAVLLIIKCTQH